MQINTGIEIPARNHASESRVKVLEALPVGGSYDFGSYSKELMHSIAMSISYYKKKKGNSKKEFKQRQVKENGVLMIRLWRTK